ncbi:MAG: hypothetical protein IJM35_07025 [Bacteroidales bacterium]|nr:hypothetical protein [Bacteroidales bacterium]
MLRFPPGSGCFRRGASAGVGVLPPGCFCRGRGASAGVLPPGGFGRGRGASAGAGVLPPGASASAGELT